MSGRRQNYKETELVGEPKKSKTKIQRILKARPFQWIRRKLTEPPPPRNKKKLKINTGEFTVPPLESIEAVKFTSTPELNLEESPEVPSSRVPQCAFLFLGLDRTGTTSTVSTLFKLSERKGSSTKTPRNSSTNLLSITEISERLPTSAPTPVNKVDLKVIDAPGLCKGNSLEEDAEIVTALQAHLKQSLPNQIPNVTFLVTRFDDNRFEGEASQLSKMFIALSHCRKYWTDSKLSNVILVLTHSSKVKQENEDIHEKLSRFQQAFHTVFHAPNIIRKNRSTLKWVRCVLVDNVQDPIGSQSRLLHAISEVVKSRKDAAINQNFLNRIRQTSKSILDSSSFNSIPIESLLPQSRRGVNQMLELILQGQAYQEEDSSVEYDEENEEQLRPYRLDYFPPRQDNLLTSVKSSLLLVNGSVTILAPNTKLMLADGTTEMVVQDLNVGEKLLDKNLSWNVITSIKTARISSNLHEGKWVGRIYVEAYHQHQSNSNSSESSDKEDQITGQKSHYQHHPKNPIVLRYKGKKVRQEELELEVKSPTTLDPDDSHVFYMLELDKLDGTFVADGFVLYHEHAAPNFKGSRTKL